MTEPASTPCFARGVRFQRAADGSAVLLVPEGIATLTETAAAVAELIDGSRSEGDIVAALSERYDAPAATLEADVRELLARFAASGWLSADSPERR